MWVCTDLPDKTKWGMGTWMVTLSSIMLLLEQAECKEVDNNTSKLIAACTAKEITQLSPGAILIANSTASMTTYRTPGDGTIESNRTLVRKILPGCGNGVRGQLLPDLAHHINHSPEILNDSAVLHHHFPHPRTSFQYTGTSNMIHE